MDPDLNKVLKTQIDNNFKSLINISLMVLSVSNLHIINSILFSYGLYLKYNNVSLVAYSKLCFYFMISVHALNFFIYFSFNKLYRQILTRFFHKFKFSIQNLPMSLASNELELLNKTNTN